MILENYVRLEPGKEKILRLTNPRIEERTIMNSKTKSLQRVRAWVANVVEEDYRPVAKVFSTLSEKLATTLQTAAENSDLTQYRVGITWHPMDYATEYTVRLI